MLALLLALAPLAIADDEDRAPATGALAGSGAPRLASEEARREGWLGAWGQVQSRATLWDQDLSPQADPATYGDPEVDPGFGLLRARLGLDGAIPLGDLAPGHQLDWAVSVGVGAPFDTLATADEDVQLVDAFARWTAPVGFGVASVTTGMQRVPFERGGLMASADLMFLERTVGTEWLTPSREIGVVAAQTLELSEGGPLLLLRAGAFNGNGNLYGDSDPGIRGTARLELALGEAYRTWSPTLENALGVGVGYMSNSELSGNETALAADLLARFKIVTLTGSYIQRTLTPGDTVVLAPTIPADTAQRSVAAQLSFWVPLDAANGLEIGGRFELFDDATHLDDLGDVQILQAGVTWRNPLPGLDLGAGYIHRAEPNGPFANDSIRVWTQIRPRFVL